MSYLPVKIKDAESVNLRDFLKYSHLRHHIGPAITYHNTSKRQIYQDVEITVKQPLGEGSTGIAYKAVYNKRDECVIKLPIRLLKANQIKLNKATGRIVIVNQKERGSEYEAASDDLNYEWENYLLLHFGKHMRKHGMGNPGWRVSDKNLKTVIDEMNELKTINGYDNIHRILVLDPEVPLLMSEYFDGTVEDLSMMLKEQSLKPPDQYIFECIIPQTLAGLHYMHSENVGLAHMDIKPMNMLYKEAQGQPYPLVVLCDFGLCQPSERPHNEYMGTPYFMAPEIDKQGTIYIPKYTDVYSWAVSMLCACYPKAIDNADESLVDYLLLQVSLDRPKFSYANQKVFEKILDIIQAKNPKKRYKKFTRLYNFYYGYTR
jgi:serine/threonine protein kinase